mmetsp:Transcript_22009/g.63107  ORF Transcript_22009/g.63107 Transcript_22009/m.63107 type:complete len:225 (-) Transcript_22009:18-692(-)
MRSMLSYSEKSREEGVQRSERAVPAAACISFFQSIKYFHLFSPIASLPFPSSSSNPCSPDEQPFSIFFCLSLFLVKFSTTYFITICSNLSVDGNTVEATVAQVLQKVAGVGVDGDGLLLEGRDLGDEVHSALALLFLKLEGDTADGALVNALHEVGGETGDLVAHALGGGDGNLVDNSLVGVEVHREAGVVLLHDGLRRLLDGLGTDTHFAIRSSKAATKSTFK